MSRKQDKMDGGRALWDVADDDESRKEDINLSEDKVVRTVISFNRGGKWQKIQAPEKSAVGLPYNCHISTECSLHLHSFSTPELFAPYSTVSAVGLIMAVGNLGK